MAMSPSRQVLGLSVAVALMLVPAAPAGAVTYGSNLRATPNAGFGCEAALVRGQGFNGPMLTPSGQRTCTYRSLGFLGRPGGQSLAPSNGRITRIRVRALRVRGRNPAPLRLTILTSSGSCCTGRYLGPVFRPRADGRVTSVPVNVRVYRTVSDQRTQSNDVLGLSAVGPGTLPLRITPNPGSFAFGNPVVTFWYPLTPPGQPRTEGYTMDGIELLFQWDFRPA
jgi:hypothetical protein